MFIRFLDLVRRALLALAAGVAVMSLARTAGWLPPVALALAALSAVAPLPGLLVVASLAPLGAALGALLSTGTLTEPLVVSVLAGAAVRGALGRRHAIPGPAALLALTVACSALVQLALRRARMGPGPFMEQMAAMASGQYFSITSDIGSLGSAALLLEGLALFSVVAAVVRRRPERLPLLARMLTVGAAGSAVLNVCRLVTMAVATGDTWHALPRLAQLIRVNAEYGDVNAAGSYFAMLLCVAAGLALCGRRGARLVWGAATVMIALALWLTSSRAAILGLLIVGAILTVRSLAGRWRQRAPRPAILAVAGLALATAMVLAYLPNRFIGGNASTAAGIRRDMAVVSFRLLARDPVFGVGIGQFYDQSGAEMQRLPVRRFYLRENAHNAFLQIGTELGLAGFACFAMVVWLAARGAWAAHRGQIPSSTLVGAIASGLAAFLLSALFGHPLLTPECAFAFWMVAGCVAGSAPERPVGRRAVAMALAAGAALLISTPLRARAIVRNADLEHLGYGLSLWEPAMDGERYRIAEGVATIFVPGDAAVALIPLRLSDDAAGARPVSLRLHGRLVDRLQISGGAWTRYLLTVPPRERSRFVPMELELEGSPGMRLFIGKVSVVQPRARSVSE